MTSETTHSTLRGFDARSDQTVGSERVRPQPRRHKRLPDLVPADADLSAPRGAFSSPALQDESTVFTERAECDSETAKMTVYVLNAILFLIAFPVGFGMLMFNILGGENLRTTAHVMALTGMGSALSFSGAAIPLIS
ncbi:MAG: hypothetical protein HRU32_04570 [Rhodobacteraceae bacterium]|nr:hypothetical protein [Paracoccaceae bacterium]